MAQENKHNIISSLEDFPTEEKDPNFWNLLKDKNFKTSVNFMVLNEVRKSDPSRLTDLQCRSQLAKIFAFVSILDFPNAFKSAQEEQTETDEI